MCVTPVKSILYQTLCGTKYLRSAGVILQSMFFNKSIEGEHTNSCSVLDRVYNNELSRCICLL